jgi:hypothetical protein
MPNPIKYSTGSETLALKKGNFFIGTGDVGKGPSDVTGYYQGPSPASGGYVIYLNKEDAPGGLSYHSAANDSELISFTNNLSGTSFTSATQCLNYYATQTDKVCVNRDYEPIVTDGLIFNLDAGFTPSYSRSGTTWYDISGSNNGTLTNGPTFNSDNGGTIVFDGVDDRAFFSALPPGFQAGMTNYSISIWFKLTATKEAPLLEMGETNTDYSRIMFWVTGGNPNRLYALGASSNGAGYRYSSVNLTNGVIYNAVYTYNNNGTISKLFINSVQDNDLTNSSTNGLLVSIANSWSLCADNVYNQSYVQSANIYNVLLYTKTLTDTEIQQNYNAQKGRFGL